MPSRRLGATLACGLALSLACPALAQNANPKWRHQPEPEDVARHYPARARHLGLNGQVLLHCKVSERGRLSYCQVIRERPLGEGFGMAAIRMSRQMEMTPKLVNGRPVAASVTLPINFSLNKPGFGDFFASARDQWAAFLASKGWGKR